MAAQGAPPQMVGPPTSGAPMPPASTPASAAMQPPPPRMPGTQGSARLTASARQEYEAYMQNRLRMMGPQAMPGGPRIPGPPPGVIPAAQPRMAIVVRFCFFYISDLNGDFEMHQTSITFYGKGLTVTSLWV